MSVDALIFWLFVLAWAVVGAALILIVVPRSVREVRGIVQHVSKLGGSFVVGRALAQAESDWSRIERAVARLPELGHRAQTALAIVRAAEFVPPEIGQLVRRLRREVAAFRAVVR